MSKGVWPFDIGDYRGDTANLTTFQHGAYLLLLMHYWVHGGLPNDDKALREIAKIWDNRQWARTKLVLAPFFLPNWKHKRLEADIRRLKEFAAVKRSAARRRWDGPAVQLEMPVDNPVENSARGVTDSEGVNPLKYNGATHAYGSNLSKKESKRAFKVPRMRAGRSVLPPEKKPNLRRKARQKWESELAARLGPDHYAVAVDFLSAEAAVCEQITDAELAEAGAGILAALLAIERGTQCRGSPK